MTAEWDNSKHHQGCRGHHGRGQQKNETVGGRRHDVFLNQHLNAIRNGLQQAELSGPIRAVADLQASQKLALHPYEVGSQQQQRQKHDSQFYDQNDESDNPV